VLSDAKQHLMMTISTVKDSSISALHDGKVGMTVGISTFLAGFTANDIAAYVGIAVSLTVMAATIINVHLSIRKSRREDSAATLKNEIDRAKLRAIKKAEELGKAPQRETD
jgi:hypothetical protein